MHSVWNHILLSVYFKSSINYQGFPEQFLKISNKQCSINNIYTQYNQ